MPKPIALSKNRIVSYVLKDNRKDPEEDQVVWQLRAVPFSVRMDIFNTIAMDADEASAGSARVDVGRKFKLACKHGIAGWSDNFADADDAPLVWVSTEKKFGVAVIDDDCLTQLPDDVISELGNMINDLATSDAHEVGK